MERFWCKVNKSRGKDACWDWLSCKDPYGCGRFSIKNKCLLAHRVAYTMMVGQIPSNLSLDHLCRNRACVNPKHLEPVTRGMNVLRGVGVGATNARKTHCPRGHEYSSKNTIIKHRRVRNQRVCRICWNASERERRALLNQAAAST